MKTSPQGAVFIAAQEGVVTRAYRDAAGIWTIGVGHTASAGAPAPRSGMVITRRQALDILASDLPKFEVRVERTMPGVAQAVFDGAVSFDFNTGAIDRATWVKSYIGGDRAAARAGLIRWTKAGGRTLAGLVRRREAEARLIFTGDYGGTDAAAASQSPSDVSAYQEQLAALGLYRGAVDGVRGAETRAAVLAYQRSHPDLVADGIVGPATRASLARDVAAKRGAAKVSAAVAATAAAAGGVATDVGASHPLLIAALAGAVALVFAGGFVIHRYGGEVRRWFTRKKGQ